MDNRLNVVCLGGLLALTCLLTQPVRANEWNKRSEFQFSAPVEIPGKVLLPGKYFFQIADIDTSLNIVQVFSEGSNGKASLVTTMIARSDYMSKTPDKPTLTFEDRPSGNPEAVHSWFYPGVSIGWEFVYPNRETAKTDARASAAQ
jgi:hypothetical protein